MAIIDNYGEGNGTPLQYSWLENPMDGVPGSSPGGSRVIRSGDGVGEENLFRNIKRN